MSVRTRFAPSPTGACTSAARARRSSTTSSRATTAARSCCASRTPTASAPRPSRSTAILDGLRWLGLDWDEGPFFQTQRTELYRAEAERLLARGPRVPLLVHARGARGAARRPRSPAGGRRRTTGRCRDLHARRPRGRTSLRRSASGRRSTARPSSTTCVKGRVVFQQRRARRLRHRRAPTARPSTTSASWSTTSTCGSRTSSAATTTSPTRRARCCSTRRSAPRCPASRTCR